MKGLSILSFLCVAELTKQAAAGRPAAIHKPPVPSRPTTAYKPPLASLRPTTSSIPLAVNDIRHKPIGLPRLDGPRLPWEPQPATKLVGPTGPKELPARLPQKTKLTKDLISADKSQVDFDRMTQGEKALQYDPSFDLTVPNMPPGFAHRARSGYRVNPWQLRPDKFNMPGDRLWRAHVNDLNQLGHEPVPSAPPKPSNGPVPSAPPTPSNWKGRLGAAAGAAGVGLGLDYLNKESSLSQLGYYLYAAGSSKTDEREALLEKAGCAPAQIQAAWQLMQKSAYVGGFLGRCSEKGVPESQAYSLLSKLAESRPCVREELARVCGAA